MSVFGVILVRIFPAFSRIRIEYGETQSISPYSIRMWEMREKWRPEQLLIGTLFTQWSLPMNRKT